jgi:hypothetical protein
MVLTGGVAVAICGWQLWRMKNSASAGAEPSTPWTTFSSAPPVASPATSQPYRVHGASFEATIPEYEADNSTIESRIGRYATSSRDSDQTADPTANLLELPERQNVEVPNATQSDMTRRDLGDTDSSDP